MAATVGATTLALPALSGLLLALSFPPVHTLVVPFVALVPWAVWIDRLPVEGEPRRRGSRSAHRPSGGSPTALLGGVVLGVVHFGLLFLWIPPALAAMGASGGVFAVVAYALVVAGLAGMAGAASWLLHRAANGIGVPIWLALPVVWTAFEWTRAHLPGGLALAWLGLGTSLSGAPELIGMAELVGERGVGFWIALIAGLITTAVSRRDRGRSPWPTAAAAVTVLALPAAWGAWRAKQLPLRTVANVAVVQPVVGAREKAGEGAPEDHAAELERLLAGIAPGSVDLVVLPEMAVRGDPRAAEPPSAVTVLEAQARRLGAAVLFGAPGRVGGAAHNSAFLMTPDGLADFRYDKRRLVPVVESGYRAGTGPRPVVQVGGATLGVLVCYESSYADEARALRLAGADVLVNITNDGWFSGGARLARTTAVWQHPAHLVMRAVEQRTGAVRSATSGISLFVDPVGRVHEATRTGVQAVRIRRVEAGERPTVYARVGDLVGTSSALAALILLVTSLLRGASGSSSGPMGGGRPSLDRSGPVV